MYTLGPNFEKKQILAEWLRMRVSRFEFETVDYFDVERVEASLSLCPRVAWKPAREFGVSRWKEAFFLSPLSYPEPEFLTNFDLKN